MMHVGSSSTSIKTKEENMMNLINRTLQILAVALLATPLSAYAESWSCSHGNDVREVHIERTTSSPVPCNVVYKKQTEGVEDQILWNATSDDSYCEEKAQGFIAKLESWGWVCAETVSDEVIEVVEEVEVIEEVVVVEEVVVEETTATEAGNNSTEEVPATE